MTKMPMNLPNRLTLSRIALIPVYFVLMAVDTELCRWIAAAVFVGAALTDLLDGRIARQRGQVTNFGKFIDPIADKLLVLLPLILLVWQTQGTLRAADMAAVLLMVAREIVVSGFRLVAVSGGLVIPAEPSGKVKTVVQMIAVTVLTIGWAWGWAVAWAAAALSVYSGASLIAHNRKALEEIR